MSADLNETINEPITREALYAVVWSEPMLKVAARFKVSSSYMARVCTRMNVPRPNRGYWAKSAARRQRLQLPLPEAQPGNVLVWSRDSNSVQFSSPLPKPPASVRQKPKQHTSITDPHPLIRGAKDLFESGRLSYEGGYLKPAKKLLVDLVVTKTGLEKALSLANALFMTLEKNGHSVVIAPYGANLRRVNVDEREVPRKSNTYNNNLWSPARSTVVYVGTVAIGLTIIEMSEEVKVRYVNGEYIRESEYVPPKRNSPYTWTTNKDLPTGRLCVQAYSPYPRANWQRQWLENKGVRPLDTRVKAIARALREASVEISQLVEEGARQAEIERQRWEVQQSEWKREQEERRVARALKESKDELHGLIDHWAEVDRIEKFFVQAEQKIASLDEDKKKVLLERLGRARAMVGNLDAVDQLLKWRAPDER